jgi:methyltransferase, FkbM family
MAETGLKDRKAGVVDVLMHRLGMVVEFLAIPGTIKAASRARKVSVPSLSLVGRLNSMGARPRTIVDIGANAGQFTAACLAYFPTAEVLAIEALPSLKEGLTALFSGNPRVTVIGKACGAVSEFKTFYQNEYDKSSSFLRLSEKHEQAFPEATRTSQIEVEVTTLDRLLQDWRQPQIDLLKLDVQGFEMEVLKGAAESLRVTRHVLLETSFAPLYEGEPTFPEYVRYLHSLGFEFVGPLGFLADPRTGSYLQMDSLFVNSALRGS